VINGAKIFITNGTWADVCVVFARTGGEGAKGISAFLVPTNTPGFERTEIHGKLGLRGQATSELSFGDVRVPADALVGNEGDGFKFAMKSLDKGRVSVSAGCTGIIQGCLEAVVDYTTQRRQFGKPIASYQMIQDMIAEMSVDVDAARLLTRRAALLIEAGQPFGTEACKAKYFASEAAVKAANLAIQAFGGYGYIDEYPVQKYMRDARVMTLYEGTSQIQKLLIGRAETGINAFV
jgi:alkylation response protein AidB-like acyl-CoA dehydrogenase